jgi:hypothetical protein
MARTYDLTEGGRFVYDPVHGHFVLKRLAPAPGTAGGTTVAADVDGTHRVPANDGAGRSPTAGGAPGWHSCLFCRGSGSCPNCVGLGVVAGDVECQVCGGSGDCTDCAGRGTVYGRPLSPRVARAAEKLLGTVRRVVGARR